jgi:hypothetical protein
METINEVKLVSDMDEYLTKGWKCVGYNSDEHRYIIQKSHKLRFDVSKSLDLVLRYMFNEINDSTFIYESNIMINSVDENKKFYKIKELEEELVNLRKFIDHLLYDLDLDIKVIVTSHYSNELYNYVSEHFSKYTD